MEEEYPSKEILRQIETAEGGIINLLQANWHWDDCIRFKQKGKTFWLELHTGGWSGNEEIIDALGRNKMFWMLYWQKSERGGHYWFKGNLSLFEAAKLPPLSSPSLKSDKQ